MRLINSNLVQVEVAMPLSFFGSLALAMAKNDRNFLRKILEIINLNKNYLKIY